MGSIGKMGDSFHYEGYPEATNFFKFNQDSPPSVLNHQDSSSGITSSDSFDVDYLINSPDTVPSYDSNHVFITNPTSSNDSIHVSIANSTSSFDSFGLSPGVGDSPEAPDFSDACLKFLTDILMEENLDSKPSTLQDYMALQATEKSLYDAIGESYSLPSDQIQPFLAPNVKIQDDDFSRAGLSSSETTAESSQLIQTQFDPFIPTDTTSPSSSSASGADDVTVGLDTSAFSNLLNAETPKSNFDWIEKALSSIIDLSNPEGYRSSSSGVTGVSYVSQSRRGRKIHQRDDSDEGEDGRSCKHTAYVEDEVQMEQYDDILLACKGAPSCWDNNDNGSSSAKHKTTKVQQTEKPKGGSKGKKSRAKKQSNNEDVLDLNPLLTQCAQAVATFDFKGANELLKRLRQHSSPYGDGIQRVAHFFADGLEARLAGSASQLYSDFLNWQISASSFLNAYRFYVKSVPFKRTSFFMANKTILKLCPNATRVHIIDFGIFCGIQWPCFIQALSKQNKGSVVLRITAVDFPERGYQPAARIEETGRRLAGYCKRFGVQFEYQPIAQRWETLSPDDFRLESNELLVVNCLYRGRTLLDDTVEVDSPRDAFLKLIKNLKPDLFIQGIVNGTYSAPFFTTRFKEALFHYSSLFDMFEATMQREGEERQLIERGLYGREILNVVACEGNDRVERPETYKQWQVRNQRAGLRQVALDREILSNAKAMVSANYHKDFVVDEVNNWMIMDALLVEGYNESVDLFRASMFLENQEPFESYDLVQTDNFLSSDQIQGLDSALFSYNLSDGDSSFQVPDFPDDCLNFISEILMEEDLDDKFAKFHDYSAIQATEQSLYDALRENSVESFDQATDHSLFDALELFDQFPGPIEPNPDHSSSGYSLVNSSPLDSYSLTSPFESIAHSSSSSSSIDLGGSPKDQTTPDFPADIPLLSAFDNDAEFDLFTEAAIKYSPENSTSNSEVCENQILEKTHEIGAGKIGGSKVRKTHQRDETDYQDSTRSSKLLASYDTDYVQMEQYDDVLLWSKACLQEEPKQNGRTPKASSKGKKPRAKKQTGMIKEEFVDLRTLLTLCAQAVSSYDMRTANELLKQIKQHSSQYGDSIERVAHYFAYGLEARIIGTGSHLSADPVVDNHVSSSDILKSYKTSVQAIPLRRTSYYLANQTIAKMAENATTIHIIDFGIFFGFQWPSFIQSLASRLNGIPKLRITGIGFPQRGFKPAATVEETGKRLEGYCKRFNVPFEYQFVSKKWDAITPDDIKANNKDELVVVNCIYESRSLFDETVEEESPRDTFLKLIRSLNPDIFVHGIINGSFNAPFFLTRFREALFHYSSIFDMLEATIPRENPERLLLERELYGKAALNVIACEGVERLERPETYKQWQMRMVRAGFRQLPLDRELVSMVKGKVKANYHKDFVLGEDGNWMLQGWKGRILYATSCWRPA
ncbi:hypothetical protein V2J09_011834 [Rumex salicifolius]